MTALDAATLANLRRTSTATICARLFRRGFRNVLLRGVRPLRAYDAVMVGPAYTLRFIPSREDIDAPGPNSNETQREAFETTPEGHVLVMDCREDTRAACCGDILALRLMVRGGAGLVSDGGMRDSAQLAAMDLPVFAGAPSPPVSRVIHHALEHGGPIACGGVAVYPGDVVVGDADGVVMIPCAIAAEVAAEAVAQDAQDEWVARRIANGAPLRGNFPPNAETLQEYESWRTGQAVTGQGEDADR